MQRRPEPTSSALWWTLALTALLVLGVAGVWQGYASAIRQKRLVESHMGHMAQLMAQSVESAMLRGLRGPVRGRTDAQDDRRGRPDSQEDGRGQGRGQGMGMAPGQPMGRGPSRLSADQWRNVAQDVLGDFVQAGQVASVGLITGFGAYYNLVGAPLAMEDVLTGQSQAELAETGRTFGRLGERDELLVLVRQLHPGMANLSPDGGPKLPQGHPDVPFQGPYLVVALDMTQHQHEMDDARFAATLQTVFAVGASAAVLLLLAVLGRRRDVSERARRLEQFQASLLDAMPEGLFEVDGDGVITGVNAAGGRLYALLDPGAPQAVGRRFTDTLLADCAEAATAPDKAAGGGVTGAAPGEHAADGEAGNFTGHAAAGGMPWAMPDPSGVNGGAGTAPDNAAGSGGAPAEPGQPSTGGGAVDEPGPNVTGGGGGGEPGPGRNVTGSGVACPVRQEIRREGLVLELVQTPLSGGARLVLVRDRTARAALEAQLEQSRTLAAIGRMASAVAHEIRNPLAALRGFAQLFVKAFEGRSPELDYARTMVAEADRLNRVVGDLLYLTKPSALGMEDVDLEGLSAKVLRLAGLGGEDGKIVPVETRLELRVKTLLADPDALTQALLNGLLNAKEALQGMPDRTGSIAVRSFEANGGVYLCVDDNGPGVPDDSREDLFSPFATTKKTGSGLGLAIVRQIMEAHHGTARLTASPEGGARLEMRFPILNQVAQ